MRLGVLKELTNFKFLVVMLRLIICWTICGGWFCKTVHPVYIYIFICHIFLRVFPVSVWPKKCFENQFPFLVRSFDKAFG